MKGHVFLEIMYLIHYIKTLINNNTNLVLLS